MKNFTRLTTSTAALLSGLFLIASCSSSGGGGSAGGGTAAVPANAVTITSANAEATTTSAVATGTAITSAFGVEASTPLTGKDIINLVLEKTRDNAQNVASVATGVDLTSSICLSGTASGTESETSTSYNASITLNTCDIGGGIVFTGSITISRTFASTGSGPFTDNASGDLTVTFTGNGQSLGFNGFSYAENGDTSTGDYTITTFTYAINPSAGGGYAVQLTQALVGNTNLGCELSSGQVVISGAGGSQARATINSDGSAKIEFHTGDGNFTETANSPLSCLV